MVKLYILLIICMFFTLGCGYDKRSKRNPPSITAICDGILIVESYTVFEEGGAIGGTAISDYLTDSVNFRIYIGTYDGEHENYSYICKGDSIYIKKKRFDEDPESFDASKGTLTILESKVFSLQALRKKKVFE